MFFTPESQIVSVIKNFNTGALLSLLSDPSCTQLYFSKGDKIGHNEVIFLAGFLGDSFLQQISFFGCQLGDKGTEEIAFVILQGFLTRVYLCSCGVTDRGAIALANAASKRDEENHLVIGLMDNQIGDQGATQFANVLWNNKSLIMLNLSRNRITDWGVRQLAHGLRCNENLKYLNLSENNITKDGINALYKVLLRDNDTLDKCYVGDMELREKICEMYVDDLFKRPNTP